MWARTSAKNAALDCTGIACNTQSATASAPATSDVAVTHAGSTYFATVRYLTDVLVYRRVYGMYVYD